MKFLFLIITTSLGLCAGMSNISLHWTTEFGMHSVQTTFNQFRDVLVSNRPYIACALGATFCAVVVGRTLYRSLSPAPIPATRILKPHLREVQPDQYAAFLLIHKIRAICEQKDGTFKITPASGYSLNSHDFVVRLKKNGHSRLYIRDYKWPGGCSHNGSCPNLETLLNDRSLILSPCKALSRTVSNGGIIRPPTSTLYYTAKLSR